MGHRTKHELQSHGLQRSGFRHQAEQKRSLQSTVVRVTLPHFSPSRVSFMNRALLAAFFACSIFSIPSAHARINCNHDPVCQAKRDGTTVEEARKKDRASMGCLSAVGYTQADWRARRVPGPQADKVRECYRRNGLSY